MDELHTFRNQLDRLQQKEKSLRQQLVDKEDLVEKLEKKLQERDRECRSLKERFLKTQIEVDKIYGKIKGMQEGSSYAYTGSAAVGDGDDGIEILQLQFQDMKNWLNKINEQKVDLRKKNDENEDKFRSNMMDAKREVLRIYEKLAGDYRTKRRYDSVDVDGLYDFVKEQLKEVHRLVEKTLEANEDYADRIKTLEKTVGQKNFDMGNMEKYLSRMKMALDD